MTGRATSSGTSLTRRNFLATVGTTAGGLMLGFRLPTADAAASVGGINAWILVRADDTVLIRINKSELGQGVLTALAQLAAEELECDWARVRTEYPTPAQNIARQQIWGNFRTEGSRSIRDMQEIMRLAGASARLMLVQAAARSWGVPPEECTVQRGMISHAGSGRRTVYGRMAYAATQQSVPDPDSIVLKDPRDWKIAGQRLLRIDTFTKTTGQMDFGVDIIFRTMMHAAIVSCPVPGGRIKRYDDQEAAQRLGVQRVLRVGNNAVAVVADTWWHAKTALDSVVVEWDYGPNVEIGQRQIEEQLAAALDVENGSVVGAQQGDATTAINDANKKIEAVYHYPYQNHAVLEPMNATARWTRQGCTVWAGSQDPTETLHAISRAAGLPMDQCEFHQMPIGGSFGRRLYNDCIVQAVLIARALNGMPVKLMWTREEDMLHDFHHPISSARLTAGLDDQNIKGLAMRIAGQPLPTPGNGNGNDNGNAGHAAARLFQGLRPASPFVDENAEENEAAFAYDLSDLYVDHVAIQAHPPVGVWRGTASNQNIFYLESFIDEIAHASRQDPLALRRKLLAGKPRHLAVLDAVAARVGWTRPARIGVHRGLAVAKNAGSYVAACAEVSVSDGRLKIHRIAVAIDCGTAINPQQIEAQVEGSIAFGLSAALYGRITYQNGMVEQQNFDRYLLMRLGDMPLVETLVMPSGGFFGGAGEPATAVAAPAVMNAIFAATGRRIRKLPLGDQLTKPPRVEVESADSSPQTQPQPEPPSVEPDFPFQ